MMRRIVYVVIFVFALAAGLYFVIPDSSQSTTRVDTSTTDVPQEEDSIEVFDKSLYSLTDKSSIWLIVNKTHPIPSNYVPTDLVQVDVVKRLDKSAAELSMRKEAADYLKKLFDSAKSDGLDLLLGSGYRSYQLQNVYYSNYVSQYGQAEADKFSARPGTSEHQTGLVADISGVSKTCYLEPCFKDSTEGKWLAKNAHKYGFIIRYPENKESITGYIYEPWHVRYVGLELAVELFENNLTMEEFFEYL